MSASSLKKTCIKCSIEKNVSNFSPHGKYYSSWCKECSASHAKIMRKKNPQKGRSYDKLRHLRNPLKRKMDFANAKAKKLGIYGVITCEEISELLERQDGKCFYCNSDISKGFQIDHFIPFAKDGLNVISNIRIACEPCNRSKHVSWPEEFMETC